MTSTALKMQDRVLIGKCQIARSFLSRFMGLMGRTELPKDEAILFPKCNSIHTFFMRFPIDVVMVDAKGKVVAVRESLKPWRMTPPRFDVKHIIELSAFRSRELGITAGTQLEVQGVWA